MKDYTPSDLPRLMVERIKRIRIRNPLRHNRRGRARVCIDEGRNQGGENASHMKAVRRASDCTPQGGAVESAEALRRCFPCPCL